jgi:hypothetical protein
MWDAGCDKDPALPILVRSEQRDKAQLAVAEFARIQPNVG